MQFENRDAIEALKKLPAQRYELQAIVFDQTPDTVRIAILQIGEKDANIGAEILKSAITKRYRTKLNNETILTVFYDAQNQKIAFGCVVTNRIAHDDKISGGYRLEFQPLDAVMPVPNTLEPRWEPLR